MPEFTFDAMDAAGILSRGRLIAVDEADVERRLARRSLTLVRARAQRSLFGARGGGKVQPRMRIELFHRLGQSLGMGIPIVTAVTELGEMLPSPALKAILDELRVSIEGGQGLSEAMETFPEVFDKLALGLVRMGEETGELPAALASLAAFAEWKEDIRSTIRRAIIYPSFIAASMSATVGVWVGYVLPQMAGLLSEMAVELPAVTRVLLDVSLFAQAQWAPMLGGALLVVVVVILAARAPASRAWMDRQMLRIPIVGELALGLAVARLSHNFATAYGAGMTVTAILGLLGDEALGNLYLEGRVRSTRSAVEQGATLSQALEKVGGFPPMMVGAVRSGESVGAIDGAFKRLGDYYDGEVRRGVATLIGALEPLTLFVLGGLFGLIILSIMLPLYDVIGQADKAY